MFVIAAQVLLLLWVTFNWHGGRLFAREITTALRGGHGIEALAISTGLGANLFNVAYELGCLPVTLPVSTLGFSGAQRALGLVFAATGLMWVIWARCFLGEAWSSGLLPVGPLCIRGPYRFVRHPIYAGAIATYSGLLIAQNDLLGCLVFGGHLGAFLLKTIIEDNKLLGSHVKDYASYATRTSWRLFPGIW
jgi:protein-S-isoprenylcysteine O-methyltransferase Ste14